MGKRISREDLKHHTYLVSKEFAPNLLRYSDDGYRVYVVVDWQHGTVLLDVRHGIGVGDREWGGKISSAYLSSLGQTQDECLDVARLVAKYLDACKASEYVLTDSETQLIRRVVWPMSGLARLPEFLGDFDQGEVDRIQWAAIAEMREVVATAVQ